MWVRGKEIGRGEMDVVGGGGGVRKRRMVERECGEREWDRGE